MKVLDLFSGIGGFSLGLHRAGMETVAFCEFDEKARLVLKKHWPDVPIYNDIKNLTVDSGGNLVYIEENGGVTMSNVLSEKYNNSVGLYEAGLSIADCAEFYGITRQAMHKILQRRGAIFRPNLKYGDDNHFYRGTKAIDRAQGVAEKAVKKGILVNPQICSECGDGGLFSDGRSKIQAHHDDYNKPLTVRWICQKCHHEWHKNNKAKGGTEEPTGTIDVVCGGFP